MSCHRMVFAIIRGQFCSSQDRLDGNQSIAKFQLSKI